MKLDGGIQTNATRNDLITVLANIESIKIKASYGPKMKTTKLSKIMMDIAIPQNTGFIAKSVETCLCPRGIFSTYSKSSHSAISALYGIPGMSMRTT